MRNDVNCCESPDESTHNPMQNCKSVYDPQEDSSLLEKHVRKLANGNVLDMGTGSGIQAIAAAQNSSVKSVVACDIQKEVVKYCKDNITNPKIKFIHSDLFEKIRGKFDTITFNPPYLPAELKLRDLTLEGGKKGHEVIEKFLNCVNTFLKPNGIVLLVFSSLTKKEKVEECIKNNLLDFEELEKTHIFFEDICVYLLRKNEFLKKLENMGITNVKYFTKGHRGMLFTGNFKSKKIVIKTRNPASHASGRMKNEANWLNKLNKHGIGPIIIFSTDDYFVYEYIDGMFIPEYFQKSNKSNTIKILKSVFDQMFLLDGLKADKEEMHHPVKHVLISHSKPYLIDFERCHYSANPKNVTQFCQFVTSGNLSEILESKGIHIEKEGIIKLAKVYKKNQTSKNFNRIKAAL